MCDARRDLREAARSPDVDPGAPPMLGGRRSQPGRRPQTLGAYAAPMAQIAVTVAYSSLRSHSFNFDHRRRPETLRTAMATAFFCPTSTTSFLPRVTPVYSRFRCSMA